jgi:glycerophosphoryl diester phosphodiesterase
MRLPENPLAAQGGPVVLAHRGWRGRFPENTMLAMEKAAELPIDGLELDIRCSQDGTVLVFHDETLERTTNGEGLVQEYTWTELRQLDAGCKWHGDEDRHYPFSGQGITIPSLEEVFMRFPDMWINIDIKQHDQQTVEAFALLIEKFNKHQHVCVGSFDEKTVAFIRRRLPGVARVASRREVRKMIILSKFFLETFFPSQAVMFQVPEIDSGSQITVVNSRFVRAAHRRGTAVHVWTVNETAEMERLLDIGVDGLITDFPDRALKLLGRL